VNMIQYFDVFRTAQWSLNGPELAFVDGVPSISCKMLRDTSPHRSLLF